MSRAPRSFSRQKIVDPTVIAKILDKLVREQRRTVLLGLDRAEEGQATFVELLADSVCLRRHVHRSHDPQGPPSRVNVVCPLRSGALVFSLEHLVMGAHDDLLAPRPSQILCLRGLGLRAYRSAAADDSALRIQFPNLPGANPAPVIERLDLDGARLTMELAFTPQRSLFSHARLSAKGLAVEIPRVWPGYVQHLGKRLWRVELSFAGVDPQHIQRVLTAMHDEPAALLLARAIEEELPSLV